QPFFLLLYLILITNILSPIIFSPTQQIFHSHFTILLSVYQKKSPLTPKLFLCLLVLHCSSSSTPPFDERLSLLQYYSSLCLLQLVNSSRFLTP
ncbi:hypothetical protein LINGRAHAP2_LOCUS24484, partial [Linum grandiflorum]